MTLFTWIPFLAWLSRLQNPQSVVNLICGVDLCHVVSCAGCGRGAAAIARHGGRGSAARGAAQAAGGRGRGEAAEAAAHRPAAAAGEALCNLLLLS